MEIKLTRKNELDQTFYYLWVDGNCEKCYRNKEEAEAAYNAALVFARQKIKANLTHEVILQETL